MQRMVPSKLGEGEGEEEGAINGERIFLVCEEADRVKKELSNWRSTYVWTKYASNLL